MGWLKLFREYKQAKDLFVRPKIGHYFGRWSADPCLPIWRRGGFHFFNIGMIWKTKWTSTDIRFEYPPSVTLVLFGYSLSFWVYPNVTDKMLINDYWECMLKYIYHWHDLKTLMRKCGIVEIGHWDENAQDYIYEHRLVVMKEFIKPEYHKEYDRIADDMLNNYKSDEDNY